MAAIAGLGLDGGALGRWLVIGQRLQRLVVNALRGQAMRALDAVHVPLGAAQRAVQVALAVLLAAHA